MGKSKVKTISKQEFMALSDEEKYDLLLKSRDMIGSLEARMYEKQKELDEAVRKIECKTFRVKKMSYERFVGTDEPGQGSGINEAEALSHRGRRRGGRNFAGLDLEGLSQLNPVVSVDPSSLVCPKCGAALLRIGEDVSYRISIEPSKVSVIKYVYGKYTCPIDGGLYEKPSSGPFGHSPATPSLAADVIAKKFELGVPLYRYSAKLAADGIPLSPQDLSNVVLASAELLRPIRDRIEGELRSTRCGVINADETPIKVIGSEEGRKTSYMFVYGSSWFERPMLIYDFSESRRTDATEDLLSGFSGTVICDSYKGYDRLKEKGIKLQRCWAHSRRRFYDIWKTLTEEEKAKSRCGPIIERFDAILSLERSWRESLVTPDEIKRRRNSEEYRGMLSGLESAATSFEPAKGSPLADAVAYFRNNWGDMRTFLSDGRVDLTNNLAERAVKPFAICRRNFLFCKTANGAEAAAVIFTVVQTARLNKLNVERYLAYVLERIGSADASELMPWSDSLPDDLKAS
jgi:transposase